MGQVVQTPNQDYYLSRSLGYDYEIKYKPGNDNKETDALSRLELPLESQILVLDTITFDLLKQVKKENETCEDLKALH